MSLANAAALRQSHLGSFIRGIAGSLVGKTPVQDTPAPTCMLEEIEPRILLSSAPVMTPDFRLITSPSQVRPAATSSPTGMSPATLRHAYGFDTTMFGSVVGDGTGQTIAIVDAYDAPSILADLRAFDTYYGLSDPPSIIKVGQTGTGTLPGADPAGKGYSWALETTLDVEWAHAAAPKANIVLVEANSASNSDMMRAVDTARKYPNVSVVSMSWGGGEYSTESTYNSYFTTPAGHGGVTFVASSGDSGAYNYNTRTIGASYPATAPGVLAVGGTRLTLGPGGTYGSESAWGNGTSSGTSGGSGGGISKYIAQPSYQRGVVTQSTTKRTIPDVAMLGDPATGVAVYDSWDFGTTAPWAQVGGTSLSAPLWAGIMAVVNQGRATRGQGSMDGLTQTLPAIYGLASSNFHDITTGNNGYAAGPGYDLVTGRGTPIVNLLVPALAGVAVNPPAPTPVIGSFTAAPATLTVGGTTTLTASGVQETGGVIRVVSFYLDNNGTPGLQTSSDLLMGSGTMVDGTTWTLQPSTAGLPVGTANYYVTATDAAGVMVSASVAVTLTAPPPANDLFAAGTALSGTAATAGGSTASATRESGEPLIVGNSGGKSVWYTWTAPQTGVVSVDTTGSNFDTLLGVYTGGTVGATTLVASNDDSGGRTTSVVTFTATAGVTYHIVVDGYNGASGNVTINLSEALPTAYDMFASPAVLTGATASWSGTNVGATRETGEPLIAGLAGGHSVWLVWTAPTSGQVSINTLGSSFDTTLGVYTGSTVAATTLVAANDDSPAGGTLTSAVTFNAIAGTTYHIAVDGYGGQTGSILLALTLT